MLADKTSSTWGIVMTCLTLFISCFQICQHLRNYSEPSFQRYIIRIIFLVPFYSVASCLALHYRDQSIYFETPRDCYEAWVIYNFMCLCMAYIGGPGAVVVKCDGKVIEPSWILCTCCCKPMPVDGFFLRYCKKGTLQFVILKPILAFAVLILFSMDLYQVSNYAFDDGYVYITIIYNLTYACALFWLLLLYVGTEELLKPYKPLLKFACFKTVIFMTFWQSFVIGFLATRFKMTPDDAEALQNYVIIVEMLVASVAMLFAFPWSEYQIGGVAKGWSWLAFTHAVSINDVLADIMHQINPSYASYVLYHDGGPEKNVKMKKFRGGERGASKEKENFSGLNSQSAMLPAFQPKRKGAGMNFTDEELAGNEDGATWYGGQEIGSNNPLNRVLPKVQYQPKVLHSLYQCRIDLRLNKFRPMNPSPMTAELFGLFALTAGLPAGGG